MFLQVLMNAINIIFITLSVFSFFFFSDVNAYNLSFFDEQEDLEKISSPNFVKNYENEADVNLYCTPAKNCPSKYVANKLWLEIQRYLIPDEHLLKIQLDFIFKSFRAIKDLQSITAAGFHRALPQHHTKIIVTKHQQIPGFIFKIYLDIQKYHSGKPEHYFWIKRIEGALLIDKAIKNHGYEHLFKVPKKWLYLLPDEPSPPVNCLRKVFILVEEDMDIYDDFTNLSLWQSPIVTKELLNAFYTILTELGLRDCAKPANCPISKDGRVAFVDTQSHLKKSVKYQKLTSHLSPAMRVYWLELISNNERKSE